MSCNSSLSRSVSITLFTSYSKLLVKGRSSADTTLLRERIVDRFINVNALVDWLSISGLQSMHLSLTSLDGPSDTGVRVIINVTVKRVMKNCESDVVYHVLCDYIDVSCQAGNISRFPMY